MATKEQKIRKGIEEMTGFFKKEEEQKGNYKSTYDENRKKAQEVADRVERKRDK